jgi:hypothetical protein
MDPERREGKRTAAAISFKVEPIDRVLIDGIAKRAVLLARQSAVNYDYQTALMDITATHANGCLLRLDELLDADDFNFAHDVFGIRRHIDRRTGKLGDHFLPRFTKAEGKQS